MIKINRHTLANGLQLLHVEQQAGPIAAMATLYRVGARLEQPAGMGLAHLMEHVMFGGSENVSDFTHEIQRAGGQDNAWTSTDFTTFFTTVPTQNLDVALRAEADRMLAPALTQATFDTQKSVVIEEFKQQCLNRPYGGVDHHLRQLVYHSHPYRFPVIGENFGRIEQIRLDDLRQWHKDYYTPDNAILAIVGDIPFDQVLQKVEHWFGDIPRGGVAIPALPVEAPATEERYEVMRGNGPQPMLSMAWLMAPYDTAERIECDILTDMLSNGRSSRMYRNLLIGTDWFTSVNASISGNVDAGILLIQAKLKGNSDSDIATARQAIMDEVAKLWQPGNITAYETERVINRMESNRTFQFMSNMMLAQSLVTAEAYGEDINAAPARYRQVTPEQLAATAKRIFSRPPCVLVFLPEAKAQAIASD